MIITLCLIDNCCATHHTLIMIKSFKQKPIMAIRLSKGFGRSPESWLQMQSNYDLWKVRDAVNLDEVSIIYNHAG